MTVTLGLCSGCSPTILFPHIPISDMLQPVTITNGGQSPWLAPDEATKLLGLGASLSLSMSEELLMFALGTCQKNSPGAHFLHLFPNMFLPLLLLLILIWRYSAPALAPAQYTIHQHPILGTALFGGYDGRWQPMSSPSHLSGRTLLLSCSFILLLLLHHHILLLLSLSFY